MNKRKPNIKFFHVFGCRCYLLNDYENVGKLKEKGDIGVFVGYSKESSTFRIYNKRTRKIHESVNVNFDEISEMASKQFGLEPGLSNLNETGKSLNPSISQVSETAKKDLEDLFQKFYDEYFDSSKILKSSTTYVETSKVEIPSNEEEVFHESSESFQEESSSSSLNDDVQQSSEEVKVPSSNTQSVSNNTVPNVDEASTSHNVFNECLEDGYFDAITSFHDLQRFSMEFLRRKCMLVNLQVLSANYPDHVYALDKALYGLKQAPRSWYDVLSQFLIDSGFQKGLIDTTLFIKKKGLWYPKDSDFDLTAYSDADHAGCHLDRKTVAEYVVVSSCCAQVLWMRTQLTDYGFFYDKVPIYCDSKSAIAISCNPVQHTRTKHIDVRIVDQKLAKKEIDQHLLVNSTSHTRWSKLLRIKGNVFAWVMFLDKIVTRINLSNRGMDAPWMLCQICGNERFGLTDCSLPACKDRLWKLRSSLCSGVFGALGMMFVCGEVV
nr:hypothetical protein [Tanacetum cinerariifolium]